MSEEGREAPSGNFSLADFPPRSPFSQWLSNNSEKQRGFSTFLADMATNGLRD